MKTVLLYDSACLNHDTGRHPESAARLESIVKGLQAQGVWQRCEHAPERVATVDELKLVHTQEYIDHIDQVRGLAENGGGMLDPDTVVSRGSYEAAIHAAGAVLQGLDWILAGKANNGFAAIRPPGHHAFPDRGTGFCIFNNVAIAARYLRRITNIRKVLIVDWDVHHGNGTQEIFYSDPTVMYVSAHAHHAYPGTGSADERGVGAGEGCTINIPITPGTSPELHVGRLRDALNGPARKFAPDFVLVSCGFDSVAGDPIGVLSLQPESYGVLTQLVMKLAKECCEGRLLSVLEGGYNTSLLPQCAAAHVRALLGE